MASFKNELARYAAELERLHTNENVDGSQPRLTSGQQDKMFIKERLKDGQRLLSNWAKDIRAEEIWAIIKKNSPATEAGNFIAEVLVARFNAEKLCWNANIKQSIRKYEMKRIAKQTTALLLSNRPLAEIAEELKAKADALREFAGIFHPDDLEVSRKDQNGSRAIKLFVQLVSDFIHKTCGQWRDSEVATLAEIAFPDREIDVQQVRSWSRRPSTQRSRAAKTRRL